MSLSKMSDYFRKKPGKVYMFLQQDFKGHFPRNERDLEADAANITNCFNKLGFKVENPLINFCMHQIESYLTEAYCSKDLSEYECILVFFVTHSPAVGQLLCKDSIFSAENIMKIFIDKGNHPDLRKILVFQASQATKNIEDSQATECDTELTPVTPQAVHPPGANFFIIKSSFELESPNESGSYFIKVLCQYMAHIGPETTLLDAMTAVLGVLKANRNKFPEEQRNKILPEVASTLLEAVRLNRSNHLNLPNYEEKDSIGKLVGFNYSYNSDRLVNAEKKLRHGTEFDVKRIKETFKSIGFKVEINDDLPADNVRKILDEGGRCRKPYCKSKECGLRHKGDPPADYSKDTCAAFAVLSHGHGNNFRTIDESINVTDALSRIIMTTKGNEERKDLSGKPKVLFLQVCRIKCEPYIQPLQFDDTLIFHSCFPEYESKRNANEGSYFIQKLCKIIDEIPHGISFSMTDILQEVQKRFVEKHGSEQMPVIYSTLTKNLLIKKASAKMLSKL